MRLLLALVLLPMLAAGATGNPHLSRALQRYNDLEYEKAQRELTKARQWPKSTLDEKVSIELLEGVLDFEMQRPEQGRVAFQRALELNPDAKLPLRVSPKVEEALEEARVARRPPQAAAPVTVSEPLPALETQESRREEPEGLSRFKLPIAIGGGVVAVGGVISLLHARSLASQVRRADPSIQTRADLDGRVSRGRTFETVGWGLIGLGVGAAVSSFLLLDGPLSSPQADVAPTPGGAHLSLSWRLP